MNLKEDFSKFFQETGWSACRLAREAGVKSVQAITRIQSGEREGLHSKNLAKLWPFLYGDKRPLPAPAQPQEAKP